MAEVEATIPENSEPQDAPLGAPPQAPADTPAPEPQAAVEEPPKRGRGRPAGSKDKGPRSTKPKVRVEPIPQPKAKAAPAPAQASTAPAPQAHPVEPVEARPPSPSQTSLLADAEPPSPRSLYRQTSAQLLNLRDVMNSQKRASAAERYTARLQAWPVV